VLHSVGKAVDVQVVSLTLEIPVLPVVGHPVGKPIMRMSQIQRTRVLGRSNHILRSKLTVIRVVVAALVTAQVVDGSSTMIVSVVVDKHDKVAKDV
jgi:hypothetical protein